MVRNAKDDLALCDKATPGPWSTGGIFDPQSKHPTMNIWGATPPGKQSGTQIAQKMAPENAIFGAMARTALPHWIERAEDAEGAYAYIVDCLRVKMEALGAAEARIEKLEAALLAYEKWEADLIMCDDAWRGSLPTLTQELYDRMIELQEMRNEALGRFADNPELLEADQ